MHTKAARFSPEVRQRAVRMVQATAVPLKKARWYERSSSPSIKSWSIHS